MKTSPGVSRYDPARDAAYAEFAAGYTAQRAKEARAAIAATHAAYRAATAANRADQRAYAAMDAYRAAPTARNHRTAEKAGLKAQAAWGAFFELATSH